MPNTCIQKVFLDKFIDKNVIKRIQGFALEIESPGQNRMSGLIEVGCTVYNSNCLVLRIGRCKADMPYRISSGIVGAVILLNFNDFCPLFSLIAIGCECKDCCLEI